MPRRARLARNAAAAGMFLLVLVWIGAHEVAYLRQADANVLDGFVSLSRPRLNRVTNFIAGLCDPMPYIVLAAVPVCLALVRGRPRVAVTLAIVLLGANETTEVLKPLLAGPRDFVAGTPLTLTNATWPSGHSTAAMALALAAVTAAPARWRPRVGAVMAAFAVAVTFSLLELGWHYPSDVLGGFGVASVWMLAGLSALWTYQARRPATGRPVAYRPAAGGSLTLGQALTPPIVMVATSAVFGLVIVAVRPHAALHYAHAHVMFVAGASVIAFLAFALASGLPLMLRSGWATGPGRLSRDAAPQR